MHKRIFFATILLTLTAFSNARADLNIFLGNLNANAVSAPMDYNTRLSNQFGLPQPQVLSLVRSVAAPADAFMVLQLAQMLGLPHERVLSTYNANRGKGWGVIAKELGIKPGSAQFHALKNGNFTLNGTPSNSSQQGKKGSGNSGFFGYDQDKPGKGPDFDGDGPGKGKGKGHNK